MRCCTIIKWVGYLSRDEKASSIPMKAALTYLPGSRAREGGPSGFDPGRRHRAMG